MPAPVDLLLITWNRREYVEKTLPTILNDPSDFQLYCWDNGSQDGTADIIQSIDDPRLVKRHLNPENVGQQTPCFWFFEHAQSDVIGKIDDDILLPSGWTSRIAPIIRKDPQFGMLGCWIFMPEDWHEDIAQQNIIEQSGERIFRCVAIQGQSFLARKEYMVRYSENVSYGLPVKRIQMSLDGLISGYPVPLLYGHNMDDPRSPHNFKTKSGNLGDQSALTARSIGFKSAESYAHWIAEDARTRQTIPFNTQLKRALRRIQLSSDKSIYGKLKWKVLTKFGYI